MLAEPLRERQTHDLARKQFIPTERPGRPTPGDAVVSAEPRSGAADQRPIADYALLSDCQSAALVDGDGCVVWYCPSRFDGPSVFASLLDPSAGEWRLSPSGGEFDSTRRYLDGSLVLETTFSTASGEAWLTDALLLGDGERGHGIGLRSPHVLVRVFEMRAGTMDVAGAFLPRPEYGLVTPELAVGTIGVLAESAGMRFRLAGPPPDRVVRGEARWDRRLQVGDRLVFALHSAPGDGPEPQPWEQAEVVRRLADTVAAWRSWSQLHQRYEGPWRNLVLHSGRVLQGLTYAPTGAVIAAATTSLPETVGGSRNWDYRYAWIRDASMTLRAQGIAACPDEATAFLAWVVGAAAGPGPGGAGRMQVVYGVAGEYDLSERELPHLLGWRASSPVRVGNDACAQNQLDLGGELLDAVHRLADQLGELDPATAEFLVAVVDEAAARWQEPDNSIWESRIPRQRYLYSALMCWVALDRGLALGDRLGPLGAQRRQSWRKTAALIASTISCEGWNETVGAYTQAFGSTTLDASALMLAITGLIPAGDPRMRATVERIAEELSAPCGLLYRYLGEDGLDGDEATFLLCTYWLVECYALAGELDRATELFERATAYANDVGLLSEEADPYSGQLLGNFPQSLSHVGLINAAWAITEAARLLPSKKGLRGR